MINSAADIGIAVALLSVLASLSGYLAGCGAYYLSRRASWATLQPQLRFTVLATMFGLAYASFLVMLPFLLLAAHWAWCGLTARRLRQEKIAIALRTFAQLRSRVEPFAASDSPSLVNST